MQLSLPSPTRKLFLATGLAALVCAGTVTGVTAAAAVPTSHHAPKVFTTDHGLCYTVTTAGSGITIPPAGSVTLKNQFSAFKPTISSQPVIHCNPVEKILPTGQVFPITNPAAHILCFPITPPTTQPTPPVQVANQFGTADLQPGQPNLLCLPTWKKLTAPPNKTKPQPPGLSHYTCYPVQVTSGAYAPPAGIMLKDEFGGPTTVTVNPVPQELCLPTQKTVVTPVGTKIYKIVPGAMHLLCFPVSTTPTKPHVFDQNQFTGPGVQIGIGQTLALCVPSTKKII
jgi:hypothetical protein